MAVIQITRTSTPNSAPASGSLAPGQLAVEMADPTRLWVGVPAALDPAMQKLLVDTSTGYLPLAGGTLTGDVDIVGPSSISNMYLTLAYATIRGGHNASNFPTGLSIVGARGTSSGPTGGPINIQGGQASPSVSGNGGFITIIAGVGGINSSTGGDTTIGGGGGGSPDGKGGKLFLQGGSGPNAGAGGDVEIRGGVALVSGTGGNVLIRPGYRQGGGQWGSVRIADLPTIAQTAVDAIWNNNGVLNIGAGHTYIDAVDDAAAAAAGVALQGIYHNAGAMRIRIV